MELHIINFRDVGGYRNRYGEVMKPNRIFRGASLDRLSPEEVAYMENELQIRYILDYRDEKEAAAKPDVSFQTAEYKRIGALQVPDSQGLDLASMIRCGMDRERLESLREYLMTGYRQMPFGNEAYAWLFEVLLRGDGGVYFHCSAGKDRTGISAMLIMMALGMTEDDMVREYMLSNEYLKEVNRQIYQNYSIPKEAAPLVDPLLGVSEENIRLSLAEIKKRYASFEEYLEQEYHVDEAARKRLRQLYCEQCS